MKKLAKRLNGHAIIMGDGGRESVAYLWCILISFVLFTLFCGFGRRGEWLCAVLYLGGSVLPPAIAGIAAAIKSGHGILGTGSPWYSVT